MWRCHGRPLRGQARSHRVLGHGDFVVAPDPMGADRILIDETVKNSAVIRRKKQGTGYELTLKKGDI